MIRDHGSRQHNVRLNELVSPAINDYTWQQTADSAFKALALSGCMTVQLRGGGRHQAALQAAYDLLDRQLLPHSTPGQAGGVGCKDLGYKQVLTYKSGPWQAGVLSSQQHSVLQKAMTLGHHVCASVMTCIAASRGVRLPQGAMLTLLDSPQMDQQRWSSSLLQAFEYSPAAQGAAAGQTEGTPAVTSGLPAEGPCAAHVDRSLLTLVYAPGQAGLQEEASLGGAPGSAGMPSQHEGGGRISTAAFGGREVVAEDDMNEVTFKTVGFEKTHTVTVSRFATVDSLVLAYHGETGVLPAQVRLIFAGRQLETDRTAADYGVESGDVIHVVMRLRGD